MKCLCLLFWLAASPIIVLSQAVTGPPGLTVEKKEWRMNPIHPPGSVHDEDPFKGNNQLEQTIRDRKETSRQNEIRLSTGLPAKAPPVRTDAPAENRSTDASSANYTYKIRVRNDLEKTVSKVVWNYVFFDPETMLEVGRHRFESVVEIKPHKSKDLTLQIVSPPTGSVDARKAGKKSSDLYIEKIVITRVEYRDGDVWMAAQE